jgi:pimeloyl-ACP methyl ester carboxylesterase
MQLQANGIALEMDDRGPPAGEPLLMIMGLGMQLVAWPDGLVDQLVRQGFRVIRFDNRDVGLSESFDRAGRPNTWVQALRHGLKLGLKPAYTLADMADDAAGVLQALGIASAHVCGASMGGMIAQHLARRHPARVRSLTLMMTSSGAPSLPGPHWRLATLLLSRPRQPEVEASVVEHYMKVYRSIGSPAYRPDPEELRQRVTASVRRSYRPDGTARQFVAIGADGDRSPWLGELRVPSVVVHGAADPLIPVPAAHDLAAKVAGAELDVIDGMGHDLPRMLWPRFVANIAAAAERAR